MTLKLFVTSKMLLRAVGAMSLALLVGGSVGCEDKAIGRPCDVQSDAGPSQAVINGQALECPTRLCLKPARDSLVSKPVTTTALCSAECSNDGDCDGDRRGAGTGDFRCESGFTCGVATVTGSFCCKKVCICRDFLPGGVATAPRGHPWIDVRRT
jgi:hypothetical protein